MSQTKALPLGSRPGRSAKLHAAPLRRPAPVVRDRRHVADRIDREPDGLQRAQGRLAAGTRSLHLDLEVAHAMLHGLAAGILGGHLRRIGRRLAAALEAFRARGGPGDHVALGIGDGDHGVVERGVHMRDACGDVLALAAADAGSLRLGHALARFLNYFFLPAIGFALPLRVRALVWVRWPWTGSPLR